MTKIEEVARALCLVDVYDLKPYERAGYTIDAWVDAFWQDWLPFAIAAISAMRQPSEAMIEAIQTTREEAVAMWTDAIDAALKEKP